MIPQVEHLHLPGPPWLFVALTVLTLSLHLVCVFFVLGGSFLASLLEGLGVVFRRQRLRDAARLLTPVLPLALSAGITLGVAPLLFIQALYPQFFYPATVLRGYWWLAVVFVLIVAFYLLYLGQSEQAKGWRNLTSAIIVRLAFIGFLYVALMYTLVSQLETHPAEWGSFVNGGLRFWVSDASTWPRLLHNVVGALVIGGTGAAMMAPYVGTSDEPDARATLASWGLRLALSALLVQIALGIWYLFSLPGELTKAFCLPRSWGGWFWMLGVFFVIGLAFVLFFALVRSGSAAARWIGAALVCLVVLGMVGGREFAKLWHLRDYFTLAEWRVESSQGSFWMFAILLVAGIVVLLWALRLAFGSKPPESE